VSGLPALALLLNALFAYIYQGPASSETIHYTAADVALLVLIEAPCILLVIWLYFGGLFQDSMASWRARRKARQHAKTLALRRRRERKFESVGGSPWHGRN
jgi:hypothetical protein